MTVHLFTKRDLDAIRMALLIARDAEGAQESTEECRRVKAFERVLRLHFPGAIEKATPKPGKPVPIHKLMGMR